MKAYLFSIIAACTFLTACGSSSPVKQPLSAEQQTQLDSLPTLQVITVQKQATGQTAILTDEFDNRFVTTLNKTIDTTLKKGQHIKLIGNYTEQDNNGQIVVHIEAEKIIRIK